jgi:hypothetical protein
MLALDQALNSLPVQETSTINTQRGVVKWWADTQDQYHAARKEYEPGYIGGEWSKGTRNESGSIRTPDEATMNRLYQKSLMRILSPLSPKKKPPKGDNSEGIFTKMFRDVWSSYLNKPGLVDLGPKTSPYVPVGGLGTEKIQSNGASDSTSEIGTTPPDPKNKISMRFPNPQDILEEFTRRYT